MEKFNSNFHVDGKDRYYAVVSVADDALLDELVYSKLYEAKIKFFYGDEFSYETSVDSTLITVVLYLNCLNHHTSTKTPGCKWRARLSETFHADDIDNAIKFANFLYDFVDKLLRNNFSSEPFTFDNLKYFVDKVGFTDKFLVDGSKEVFVTPYIIR